MKRLKFYRLLSLICLLLLAGFNQNQAQEFLEFQRIIAGSYDVYGHKAHEGDLPRHVSLTTKGGSLESTIKFKQAGNNYCHAVYRFEWKFSSPIDRLYKGNKINVDYRVTLVEGPCKGDRAKLIVNSSSGMSPQFKQTGIRPRPAIRVNDVKWISTGEASYASTSQIDVFNTNGPATLKFQLESSGPVGSSRLHYEVVYLFE